MLEYQRRPTKKQVPLVALMTAAYAMLLVWVVPELIGVFNPATEDTYSEWVWDLPKGVVYAISTLHFIGGAVFLWSSVHFVVGYLRRH